MILSLSIRVDGLALTYIRVNLQMSMVMVAMILSVLQKDAIYVSLGQSGGTFGAHFVAKR
jgi:hypothetical protein